MAWDPHSARRRSRSLVGQLEFPQPPDWYPIIERGTLRSLAEVQNRALVGNVIHNCSYRMPTEYARAWLGTHGLIDDLTPGEVSYLDAMDGGLDPASQGHRLRVEALWILTWSLSLTPTLDWGAYCADEMASWLPDLRAQEDPARFRATTTQRDEAEILDEVDAAYCLTWGCARSNLEGRPEPGRLGQYVMWERRRALEWLVGDDWDEPELST